jgi:chromosome partitioning protein
MLNTKKPIDFLQLADISSQIQAALKSESSRPNEHKQLEDLTASDVAKLLDITTNNLYQQEKSGKLPQPKTKPNSAGMPIRHYSLENVEVIRKILGKIPDPIVVNGVRRAAVLTMSNLKGGVGKSTIAIHVAQSMARRGYKVLLVDLDAQATTTSGFDYVPMRDLTADDTLLNALIENPYDIESVIRKTYWHNLDLIPSHLDLQNADVIMLTDGQLKLGSPVERVKNALDVVQDVYDIIIIDTPPSASVLSLGSVIAADYLVVPLVANMPDIEATAQYFQTLNNLIQGFYGEDYFVQTKKVSILVNRFDKKREAPTINNKAPSEQQTNLSLLRSTFGDLVLDSVIKQTPEMQRANNDMCSLYENRPRGGRDTYKAAIENMEEVADEVLRNIFMLAGDE